MKIRYKWNGKNACYTSDCWKGVTQAPPVKLAGPFPSCGSCPYPGHGFICWNRHGPCMREIVEKAGKGVGKNDASGTVQC